MHRSSTTSMSSARRCARTRRRRSGRDGRSRSRRVRTRWSSRRSRGHLASASPVWLRTASSSYSPSSTRQMPSASFPSCWTATSKTTSCRSVIPRLQTCQGLCSG
ncbi:hypothetical protein VHUM_02724 [Vanrija humicola]|uniref:Uncharacterized protein n=1 Tax=Vanrija humicola TaxID=5417 RepID=A0A7D8V0P1_VANHU|nr:hypothetical protein VHUM_02724 [Vanrija humicola]